MSKLTELAAQCEQADPAAGNDLAYLDLDIHRAIGNPDAELLDAPAYTASLDAAMTLVPEEVRLAGLSQKMNGSGWYVHLMHRESREHFEARGDTCPLTLCAAALRARGTMEDKDA